MLKCKKFLSVLIITSMLWSISGNIVFAENNEVGVDSYVEIENLEQAESNIQEEDVETVEILVNNESDDDEINNSHDIEATDESTDIELFSNNIQLFSSWNAAPAKEYANVDAGTRANCVLMARYLVPSLPRGITYLSEKRALIQGHTPKVGAIAIGHSYYKNPNWVNGHVSYVERVNGDGTITTIDGGYSGTCYRTTATPDEMGIEGYWYPSGNIPPSTHTHIWQKSFFGCIGLEEFIVPENVTVIDGFAFMNCTNLKYITIPDAVSSISLDTFNNCRTINIKCYDESYAKQYAIDNYIPYEILIPEAVDIKKFTLMGDAITGCQQSEDLLAIPSEININDVELENDNQTVRLMSTDEEIKINTIGASTFEDNVNIVSLSIDEGIETIEDAAFRDCTDLKFADIPESITDIADNAFDGCDNLIILCAEGSAAEEYAIENNIEYVINKVSADGEWEYDETTGTITKYLGNGTDIVIPDEIDGVQITSIGSSAFENNDTIEKVLIPYTVVSVGENAFAGCTNLKEATIGYGVEIIEDNAFAGCDGLNLIFDGTVENISDMAFDKDNITFSIYYCGEEMYDYTQNHDIEIIWLNDFDGIEDEKTIEMSVSKDDNGDYIVTISNTTENKSSGVLCFAEYDENDVLLNIQSQNIVIPTDTSTMSFTPMNSSANSIKCLMWNDLKNMQPICRPVEW